MRGRLARTIRTGVILMLLVLLTREDILEGVLRLLGFQGEILVYERESMGVLLLQHVVMVLVSSAVAAAFGLGVGILVTRPRFSYLLEGVQSVVAGIQTIPPVAVITFAVPALGFGFAPAVAALFLYGMLPPLNNTIAGMRAVDPSVKEAARGMGMEPGGILREVELPLAWPVILAGLRTSVVINVGTATLGAVVGAGGLGVVIIAGLVRDNPALILSGALLSALLAFAADGIFSLWEEA
ncbi:ABC-type transporter, integral membrane subunit [Spirochaeta thermophila DSM 6578]|uniref:ABC-type transporter, integral membrane subunit n=1 Tax=Winmispira thermophila (strain ATCC 700085 / DSM 6578 / Z-1203) TaxID=869211 RepID=G0GF71_WINT7|nr:ABC transporter permease [Spirochaeta thermophila]AEJ60770.1 ABC-type transporter, integral membrane subunit [Spirochaeta thermophila DSM 6578]